MRLRVNGRRPLHRRRRNAFRHVTERAAVQRRTIAALVVAAIALVVLVGVAEVFVFGPGEECGLGMSQVHIVHDTGERVTRPADARLAIHGAYEVDPNDTDRRFTIRDIGPNQSEFNQIGRAHV